MPIPEIYEDAHAAQEWPSDFTLYAGRESRLKLVGVGDLTGATFPAQVRFDSSSTAAKFEIQVHFDAADGGTLSLLFPSAGTLQLFGKSRCFASIDAVFDGEPYPVVEGEIEVHPIGSQLPVELSEVLFDYNGVAVLDDLTGSSDWRRKSKTTSFDADGNTTSFTVPEGEFVAGSARLYYRGYRTAAFVEDAAAGTINIQLSFGAPKIDSSSPGSEIILDYEIL